MSATGVSFLPELIRSRDTGRIWSDLHPAIERQVERVLGLPPGPRRCLEDEDVLAEATYAALGNVSRYGATFRGTSEGQARAWLATLTRNAAYRVVKRRRARAKRFLLCDPADLESLGEAVHPEDLTPGEAARILERAVPNPVWRRVWRLHNQPGNPMDPAEIARHVDMTPGSVAVTLSRVRTALRRYHEAAR